MQQQKAKTVYHVSRGHALIDPTGKGVHFGSEHRCLAEYHLRRFKRPFLCDNDVENAKVALKASQWKIRSVTLTIADVT